MAIYLFMNLGTWAVILCMRQNGRMLEDISDLSGLGRTQPGLALALGIFMFALAGIPPTAGFFGKLYVFLAAIDAHLVGLAVIGVVASVVGAFYYLRIVKVMYFDEPLDRVRPADRAELKGVLVGHRRSDDVLHPVARPDRRRRRGGGGLGAVSRDDRERRRRCPQDFRLLHFATIGSTNDEAKALARAGAADGTLVWADEQTAGRGRRGRAWLSPPRQSLSVAGACGPTAPPAHAAQLGFVAALGLGDALLALAGAALRLSYKWPNDLLADGSKLAGILLESETRRRRAGRFRRDRRRHQPRLGARGRRVSRAPRWRSRGSRVTPARLLEAFVRHFAELGGALAQRGFRPGPRGLAGAGQRRRRAHPRPPRAQHA